MFLNAWLVKSIGRLELLRARCLWQLGPYLMRSMLYVPAKSSLRWSTTTFHPTWTDLSRPDVLVIGCLDVFLWLFLCMYAHVFESLCSDGPWHIGPSIYDQDLIMHIYIWTIWFLLWHVVSNTWGHRMFLLLSYSSCSKFRIYIGIRNVKCLAGELPAPHWAQRSVRSKGCGHQFCDEQRRSHHEGPREARTAEENGL